jgi:phage terminase large subunit-like protein
MSENVLQALSKRPLEEQLAIIDAMPKEAWLLLMSSWRGEFGKARPEQLAPEGDYPIWVYLAGRGSGKNRSGSEWIRVIAGCT